MDLDAYRELKLLTEITSSDSVTQRRLAHKYRLALGLTNFLLRRLVKKGYVKLVNLERNRLRYLITPTGLAEKTRLTYEYLECSLALYRQMRTLLTRTLSVILQSGSRAIVLYGTGEVAEIVFGMLQQRGLAITAVVDESPDGAAFMHQPVQPLSALAGLAFDRVVIASFKDHRKIIQQLCRAGVPVERIITISEEEPVAPADVLPDAMLEAADVIAAGHTSR